MTEQLRKALEPFAAFARTVDARDPTYRVTMTVTAGQLFNAREALEALASATPSQGWDEAIEAAAKVADDFENKVFTKVVAHNIATAIRSLSRQPGASGGGYDERKLHPDLQSQFGPATPLPQVPDGVGDFQSKVVNVRAPVVPEGWQLVPKEPTEEMYAAANREWDGRMSARSCGVWQAMLASAPAAPGEGK